MTTGGSEPEAHEGRDEASPVLPWRQVRREALRATTRGWPRVLGVSFGTALLAGLAQWLLAGGNEKAWDSVTSSSFLASLITLGTLILLWVAFEVWRAPTLLARRHVVQHRNEVAALREELETRVARHARSSSPLEDWIQRRLSAADELAGQRSARGDDWYFSAMGDWDTANVKRMAFADGGRPALAPDLVNEYRADPRTGQADGIYPPQDAAEYDRYFEQRKASLKQTLNALRASTIEPPEPEPEIPKEHREELQALAAGLESRLELERRSVYAPREGSGSQPVAQSFRAHFPKLTGALASWDELVSELDEAREMMQEWIASSDPALAGIVAYEFARVIERGGDQLHWVDAGDYLGLGSGLLMVDITDDLDVDEFKRPYNELLARALTTDEAVTLRRARLRVDAAKVNLGTELERTQALHVIRGRCQLCA